MFKASAIDGGRATVLRDKSVLGVLSLTSFPTLTTLNHGLDPVELDFILEYVLSAIISIMSYWFRQDKVLTAEDLIALMHDLMENDVMKRLSK